MHIPYVRMAHLVNVPEIARRIAELHSMLKKNNPLNEIGKKINDVLIYADKVPVQLLRPAWELFAKNKGVEAI